MAAAATTARRGWGMSSATGTTRMNRMADGPDGMYAVGGGQYLRVFQVSDPCSGSSTPMIQEDPRERTLLARGQGGAAISEVVNLWKSNWPVGKGVNDVDWGVAAWDHKLVTATPSGNFMLFDVEKGRLDREISSGSFRPLNCAQFCHQPSYCHMVLIGGADGNIKLLDLRTGDPPSRRPLRHSSAITSLCFSPNDASSFVIGLDDGTIKRYDWRMAGKHLGTVYGAHGSKAVMDLKWKPADDSVGGGGAGWLASAGANKIVQIWDMNQSWEKAPTAIHSLHTAHPVRRIAWRPDHPTELLVVPLTQPLSSSNSLDPALPASPPPPPPPPPALLSASSSTDNKLNMFTTTTTRDEPTMDDDSARLEIWHVRRHYIAKYAIPSQDGVAVDASWRGSSGLVVTFQNGGFAQLDIPRKLNSGLIPLPLDQIPRQIAGWSAKGDLYFAIDKFRAGEIPFDDLKPEYANHYERLGRPTHSLSDPPYIPLQTIGSLALPDPHTDPSELAFLANWYRLEGGIPADLCAWNRDVAKWCGREDDARLWGFVKGLFEEFMPQDRGGEEGTFVKDVWGRGGKPGARVITPPDVSPRGRHVRLPLDERLLPTYAGIPLERITPPASPPSNPSEISECSDVSDSGSSDEIYSDEDQSESSVKPRSKFISFIEPQSTSGLKLDLSAATIRKSSSFSSQEGSSPVFEKKKKTTKQQPPGETSTSISTSPIAITNPLAGSVSHPNSISKKSNLSKIAFTPRQHQHQHHSHHPHQLVSSSDWPDPYGIIPDQVLTSGTMTGVASTTTASTTPTGTSRASTSQSSPVPPPAFGGRNMSNHNNNNNNDNSNNNNNAKNSPRAGMTGLAGHEIGSGVVEAPLAGRGSAEGGVGAVVVLPNGNGPGPGSRVGSGQGKEMRGREEKFEKKEWQEYRKKRVATLMTWWDGCVENGEMQLAATIALIASPLVNFPPFQVERLAHAYVQLLERHRLPIFAAYIRRFSGIPSLEITPQDEGLTHTYFCERCGKSTGTLEDIEVKGKVFWWCKKCRMGAKRCAVCRKTIKGLWMGCRQCGHGGHQACMRLYHSQAPLIPIPLANASASHASHIPHTLLNTSSSAYNQSAGSNFTTLSSTVEGTNTDLVEKVDGGEGAAESRFTLCPTGCGCQCRRIGAANTGHD
ncbi:vacuolar protein [Cryptococcus neoformans Tu259-1]|uniref:Vacuolar protein n=1 Tax=Cryptococcus neoformans Tu259-1 TaxID=1230072 RepID=A0A854QFJ9_CRYNE|nr:vacuolar protein [Cryptococcus neoformans var. grubii Tu259-1]